MSLDAKEVQDFIGEIWKLLLSEEVLPVSTIQPRRKDQLIGRVEIRGNWKGSATLEMPVSLARKLTANLMKFKQVDQVTPELYHDAVAEIVNIFAGYVRAALPPPCRLSLPVVTPKTEHGIGSEREQVVVQQAFQSCQEQFVATIMELTAEISENSSGGIAILPREIPRALTGSSIMINGKSLLIQSKSK